MSVPARLNRRGGTLPLTILLLCLMGVGVAVSYSRVSSERRITGDSRAQLGAFAAAQSGINRFLSTLGTGGVKPFDPVTATYNDLPNGTARVDMRMLRDSTITLLPAVYVITSRGTYTGAKRYNTLVPPAERTVATYALWVPAPFDLNGAFTSLSGINKQGNNPGSFSGFDRCGAQPAIPGVAVPTGGYSATAGGYTGIVGNPNNLPSELGTGGPGGETDQAVDIDWAGIIAGTYLPPDYVHPAWPVSWVDWPVVRVNNSGGPAFTLPAPGGKGILIVTGDLQLNGDVLWEGLVLVGGMITGNGANRLWGAVVSGLNVKLGMAVPPAAISNGLKDYKFDSCNLARALGQVGSIQRVRNGWNDTWPSY